MSVEEINSSIRFKCLAVYEDDRWVDDKIFLNGLFTIHEDLRCFTMSIIWLKTASLLVAFIKR